MRFILPVLSMILLLTISCKQTTTQNSNITETYADSLAQASIDSSMIAGAALLIAKGDSMILDKAYGYASLELQSPIPENAQFEIGSVTKQFTAAAILKLVENGKISLEDDFTKYLNFDTKGRTITIDELLNHTSGIPSYTEIPEFWKLSLESHPRDTLVRLVESKAFLFEPGEALIYNNSGYFFLGLIIEKVSGKSYEEYLKETFFDPLGMDHTTYCSSTKVTPGKVYGYNMGENGLEQKPYLDHTWPYAAGSLCSTTQDLYTWMKALHGGRVLPDSLYRQMITPKKLNNGAPLQYAMGVTNHRSNGYLEISHGGGINGFLSDTRYLPEENLYVIGLVNTTGPHGPGRFTQALIDTLVTPQKPVTKDLDTNTETLTGTYEGQVRGLMLNLRVEGFEDGIILQPKDAETPDTVLTYLGNTTWFREGAKFRFEEDTLFVEEVAGYYKLVKK
ncbi:serine hydrolase domain-containing protein [Robertkochia flava]|uniref:serine hydrolase domain-containing protein n=1 Tax=Robertkochia flava TaxID=3447986 RepID=UPI001CCC8DCD|nr:serine hydrolase domain-containing protein [Robertkochia marina]